MTIYGDWKAPKSDEQTLIWPEPPAIVEQTLRNTAALRSYADTRIQNTPLPELRRQTRRIIACCDLPIIATGHQIEMYHPGVWVKNILADEVARRTGGKAVHLAVDTDVPKHLQLRWPGGSVLMSDDAAILDGAWSGLVSAPTPRQLTKIESAVHAAGAQWAFTPVIDEFLNGFRENITASPLSEALTAGAKRLDDSLGLHCQYALIGPLLDSDGYLSFVHHIASDAERFVSHYNAALADYRAEANITSPSRPMPDLHTEPDRIEIPFWLDDLRLCERVRAEIIRTRAGWALDGGDERPFIFDPTHDAHAAAGLLRDYLARHGLRLSPRALTLTMFFRLLLVDQFVHGIGGARYDQVTDRIIRSYFKIDPPAFSVTTATLYFPGAGEREQACIPCLMTEGHRLRHNIMDTKPSHLAGIVAAPRRSMERRARYVAMHRDLAAAATAAEAVPAWRQRLEKAIERNARDAVLFDRELFYGLQTRERLTAMIDRYRIAFQ